MRLQLVSILSQGLTFHIPAYLHPVDLSDLFESYQRTLFDPIIQRYSLIMGGVVIGWLNTLPIFLRHSIQLLKRGATGINHKV